MASGITADVEGHLLALSCCWWSSHGTSTISIADFPEFPIQSGDFPAMLDHGSVPCLVRSWKSPTARGARGLHWRPIVYSSPSILPQDGLGGWVGSWCAEANQYEGTLQPVTSDGMYPWLVVLYHGWLVRMDHSLRNGHVINPLLVRCWLIKVDCTSEEGGISNQQKGYNQWKDLDMLPEPLNKYIVVS